MRLRLGVLAVAIAAAVPAAAGSAPQATRAGGDWTRFGYDAARHDVGPSSTGITAANVAGLHRQQVALPGTVDASPIYLRNALVAGARRTAIDQLIRPEQRLAANSLLGTCFQLGQDVLGPAAGGLLIAGPGPGVALLVDAASFAVLGGLALALPVAARTETGAEPEAQGPRLSVLRSVPRFVLWLIGVTFVFNFLYGPIDVGLPIFVRHSLGEGSTLYGQMFTVFGVGSLVGSLAVGGLRRESMVQWIMVLSIIGWGGAALLLAAARTPAMALLAFGLGGLLYGPSTAAVVPCSAIRSGNACGASRSPGVRMTARSRALRSSRTFPGQG